MSKNSFLHPVNQVRFGTYKPEHVKEALDAALKEAASIEKSILAIPAKARTFENTIIALSESTEQLGLVAGIVGHLSGVLGKPWQKYDELISEKSAKFTTRRSLNKRLYQAIMVIKSNSKKLNLSSAQLRLVDDYVSWFERSGITLPEDQKRRLKQLSARLAKLSSVFERNATQGSDKAHLVVKDAEDLAGVDDDLIELWQKTAKEKGKKGYYIQYSSPHYDAIMRFCDVKNTRVAFHKVSSQRAPKNEKVIYETLALRKELAGLLGYKNFVDYVVERRMAKSSKKVGDFNIKLYQTFKPAMLKEAAQLTKFIKTIEKDPQYKLDATDVMGGIPLYYGQKMNSSASGVDMNAIREYLPLDQVVEALFKTLHTLYGVTIKPANEPAPHKDVKTYHVYDEKGRHLSTVWCDWFARQGKRAGAWCNTFYEAPRANDTIDEPHLGLVCANFTPPTKTKPSLLSIRDAETVWHEFGHFMHATCSKTELREQGGFRTKWDFVEAPSQIMENWIWTDQVLSDMARHYKTKKPLPKDIINKLRKTRVFWSAHKTMWTLHWSTIDQMLHTKYDPAKDGPLFAYCHTIKGKHFAAKVPLYDQNICTFTHIFAGGYYGAYYSYQWAEAIEADLFSRFEKEGIFNPKTGRDYRDKVLARGDEVDPDVLIRGFLGRDTTLDAMLKRDGISS